MEITDLISKIIRHYDGRLSDIHHTMAVYSFALTIARGEKADSKTMEIIEASSILHDIACPLCRKKYGDVDGKHQETESPGLVREFLKDTGYTDDFIERMAFLTGHHHTVTGIDSLDWQILVEADYLVNAYEMNLGIDNIKNTYEKVFRTATGKAMLKDIYKF